MPSGLHPYGGKAAAVLAPGTDRARAVADRLAARAPILWRQRGSPTRRGGGATRSSRWRGATWTSSRSLARSRRASACAVRSAQDSRGPGLTLRQHSGSHARAAAGRLRHRGTALGLCHRRKPDAPEHAALANETGQAPTTIRRLPPLPGGSRESRARAQDLHPAAGRGTRCDSGACPMRRSLYPGALVGGNAGAPPARAIGRPASRRRTPHTGEHRGTSTVIGNPTQVRP